MDVLKFSKIFYLCSTLFFITSCSKVVYLAEQGTGQISLLTRARPNEEVLKSVKVPKKYKYKIRKIEELKDHFYKYWNLKKTSIYSKTTFLDSEAVTHLVISSPYDKIEARKECFIIIGCFPYLGFFKKESALEYKKGLEKKGFVTYMRPVYAYSTLGYFTDTILSSFFRFKENDLTELVFHELFHTIFFVKNEVELNENLANYFGKEMAFDYLKVPENEKKKKFDKKRNSNKLREFIISKVKKLNGIYEKRRPLTKMVANDILKEFLEKEFLKEARNLCNDLNIEIKKCFPLKRTWNNASFSTYLTYEKESDRIERLRQKRGGSLVDFFKYIQSKYEDFKELDSSIKEKGFSNFLFSTIRG
jgi:predicted aminopeptidase